MSKTRKISIVWMAEDVEYVAKEMEVTISQDQIGDVLDLLENKHDATLGITWDTIEAAIEYILEDKK